ncbi:MAG: hypothetical protein ACRETI_02700 [Steroidobacteraceae bacterium]
MDLAVRHLLTRILNGLVLLFIIMALQNLGVELLPLIAGLAIAGAGLTIVFTRPFQIGGYIRQLGLKVGVAYNTPLDTALAVVRELVSANPRVLRDPEPVIGVALLADSSVSIAVRPRVRVSDFGSARAEINQAVVHTLGANDIRIPFPQQEVRLLGQA